jgi:molybdate transport system substrate-binding protein
MNKSYTVKKSKMLSVILIVFCLAVNSYAEKSKVRIAIAVALVPAMSDIEKIFEEENPGIDLEVTSGASGKLTTQIMNGAPYDIFASADMEFPVKLKSQGLTSSGPEIYAEGNLVLFTVKSIDLTKGLTAIKNKQVGKISIANPDISPYGKAAVTALEKAGLFTDVKTKLVYAGNMSQAAQYVITGADIGLVPRSIMFDPSMLKYKENINWVTLPEKAAPSLKQGIVLLSKSGKNEDAIKIYKFILSIKAKAVFKKYGYC